MAKMQTFVINPEADKTVVAKLTGQAGQVWNAMKQVNKPVTGPELNEFIEENMPFKTRQDSLRVTLYYLVVLKGKGLFIASRPAKPVVEERDFVPGECSMLA